MLSDVVTRLDRVTQYTPAFNVLGRPVKPGDDKCTCVGDDPITRA